MCIGLWEETAAYIAEAAPAAAAAACMKTSHDMPVTQPGDLTVSCSTVCVPECITLDDTHNNGW
jgi:hypothetical protein